MLAHFINLWGNDFIEYWSAFQLLLAGKDIYSPQEMLAVQSQILQVQDQTPLMMWNPPWLLLLMFPILVFDYHTSLTIWTLLNIALAVFSAILISKALRFSRCEMFLGLGLLLALHPVVFCITLGQVSLLLLTGTSLLFYGLQEKNSTAHNNLPYQSLALWAGLILLSIKPHVLYLILFVVAANAITKHNIRHLHIIAFAIATVLVLSIFILPADLATWFQQLTPGTRPKNVPSIYEWAVPTLIGTARELLNITTGSFAVWPMFVIPSIALLLCYHNLILCNTLSWKTAFLPLLCLSTITTPFAWQFDFAVLGIVPFIILRNIFHDRADERAGLCANRQRQVAILLLYLLLNILTLWGTVTGVFSSHDDFAFFAPALSLLAMASLLAHKQQIRY